MIPAQEIRLSLEQELLEQRLKRIREIEALGFRPYGARFDFTHTIPQYSRRVRLEDRGGTRARAWTSASAGRIQTLRRMGKAGFAHLVQNGERLQVYIKKDAVAAERLRALPAAGHRRHRRRPRATCSAPGPAN